MKRLILIILFFPLLISWIITVLLFLLLNKLYPAKIWNWKNVYLINGNEDFDLKIIDDGNGSETLLRYYYNHPVKKRFIFVKNSDDENEVHVNTSIKNIYLKD